jgi:two-component system cell cycle response regulator DivK
MPPTRHRPAALRRLFRRPSEDLAMAACTVLIVEDNPNNRMIMRDMMEVQDYAVLEALDGPSGLAMAVEHLPDLILMDVQLPGMDGYEVTRRLRSQESTKGIPVVAVTSFAMKGEEERAREAGCNAYISKPIDIHKLVETVKKLMLER